MSMNREDIKLIEPVVELKSEFLAMAEEFKAESRDTIDGIGCIETGDFENSIRRAKGHVRGVGLPEGWVPGKAKNSTFSGKITIFASRLISIVRS